MFPLVGWYSIYGFWLEHPSDPQAAWILVDAPCPPVSFPKWSEQILLTSSPTDSWAISKCRPMIPDDPRWSQGARIHTESRSIALVCWFHRGPSPQKYSQNINSPGWLWLKVLGLRVLVSENARAPRNPMGCHHLPKCDIVGGIFHL
jgi:hypothetical protein